MVQKTTVSVNNPDFIIEDGKSLAVKDKVMSRLRANSVYNSIGTVATFIGTMFSTMGAGAALQAAFATGAAVTMPVAAIVGVLAIGAAFLIGGVAANYAASRIYQGANFDNLEANADSTARHLVKELKVNNMCLETGQSASCDKEKEWVKTIEAQRQQVATEAAR